MKPIELMGQVDELHQLSVNVPPEVRPGPVKVTLEIVDEEPSWAAAIGQAWAEDWSDPREDIYTLEDGDPVDESR